MSNQRKIFELTVLPSRIDPNYADRSWQIIEHGINKIFNHNDSELSKEELYMVAYNMVLNKFGEMQYNGLVVTVTRHLEEMRTSIEPAQGSFLDGLNCKWTDYTESMQKIRDILIYLDHTYVPTHQKKPIKELGLNLWRDHIIHSAKIQTRLVDSLIEQVHRDNEPCDHDAY